MIKNSKIVQKFDKSLNEKFLKVFKKIVKEIR